MAWWSSKSGRPGEASLPSRNTIAREPSIIASQLFSLRSVNNLSVSGITCTLDQKTKRARVAASNRLPPVRRHGVHIRGVPVQVRGLRGDDVPRGHRRPRRDARRGGGQERAFARGRGRPRVGGRGGRVAAQGALPHRDVRISRPRLSARRDASRRVASPARRVLSRSRRNAIFSCPFGGALSAVPSTNSPSADPIPSPPPNARVTPGLSTRSRPSPRREASPTASRTGSSSRARR